MSPNATPRIDVSLTQQAAIEQAFFTHHARGWIIRSFDGRARLTIWDSSLSAQLSDWRSFRIK